MTAAAGQLGGAGRTHGDELLSCDVRGNINCVKTHPHCDVALAWQSLCNLTIPPTARQSFQPAMQCFNMRRSAVSATVVCEPHTCMWGVGRRRLPR